jgi:CheY-like chemotaxis protein
LDLPPVSILVIDGDAASRNYLASRLRTPGFQVFSAGSGREGLISAWRDQPGLIIFDPDLPDVPGLDLVTRLKNDRRTAKVPCVAFSNQDDPQEMSVLLAAGCNEYLVKSGEAISHLLGLIPRLVDKDYKPPESGKLIVFLSAKGGLGTSSLCANFASCSAIANPEKRFAVLDLVLPVGSIDKIVGSAERINVVSVSLQSPETTNAQYFKEAMVRLTGWQFGLLAGCPDPASAYQLADERVPGILHALLESHDTLFVDVGRSLSNISMPIIKQANVIALITGTDLATCQLTQTVHEYLLSMSIDPRRIFMIQNRSVGLEGLTRTEVEKMVGLPIRVTIPNLGDNLTVANNRHEPFTYRFPSDSASMTFKRVAAQLLELSVKQIF